jgi:hypothetical protein
VTAPLRRHRGEHSRDAERRDPETTRHHTVENRQRADLEDGHGHDVQQQVAALAVLGGVVAVLPGEQVRSHARSVPPRHAEARTY